MHVLVKFVIKHGSETWTCDDRNKRRKVATKQKFMGLKWINQIKWEQNTEIHEKLKFHDVVEESTKHWNRQKAY